MHKKEMKTTYCPSAGITRIRFWGRPELSRELIQWAVLRV